MQKALWILPCTLRLHLSLHLRFINNSAFYVQDKSFSNNELIVCFDSIAQGAQGFRLF